jgi:hypothetical protein
MLMIEPRNLRLSVQSFAEGQFDELRGNIGQAMGAGEAAIPTAGETCEGKQDGGGGGAVRQAGAEGAAAEDEDVRRIQSAGDMGEGVLDAEGEAHAAQDLDDAGPGEPAGPVGGFGGTLLEAALIEGGVGGGTDGDDMPIAGGTKGLKGATETGIGSDGIFPAGEEGDRACGFQAGLDEELCDGLAIFRRNVGLGGRGHLRGIGLEEPKRDGSGVRCRFPVTWGAEEESGKVGTDGPCIGQTRFKGPDERQILHGGGQEGETAVGEEFMLATEICVTEGLKTVGGGIGELRGEFAAPAAELLEDCGVGTGVEGAKEGAEAVCRGGGGRGWGVTGGAGIPGDKVRGRHVMHLVQRELGGGIRYAWDHRSWARNGGEVASGRRGEAAPQLRSYGAGWEGARGAGRAGRGKRAGVGAPIQAGRRA